jgi:hypothetical protein
MQQTKQSNQLELSDIETAYLAGIIDGEGSIHICRPKRGGLYPRIGISNTSKNLIKWLHKKIGSGCIHIFHATETHRICYYLTIEKVEIVKEILERILPYLIVKQNHAETMLEFINLRQQHEVHNTCYTERELTLYFELKKLNRRRIKG